MLDNLKYILTVFLIPQNTEFKNSNGKYFYLFFPFPRFKCQNLIYRFVIFTFNCRAINGFHPEIKDIINGFVLLHTGRQKVNSQAGIIVPKVHSFIFLRCLSHTFSLFSFHICCEIKSLAIYTRLLFMRYLHE